VDIGKLYKIIKKGNKIMNKATLLKRLTDIEWDDFEMKDAAAGLPKNIWETVSAFANSSGGWVVLGVAQKGKSFEITGVNSLEKLEQDFVTVLRSRNKFNVLIAPKCRKYNINDKIVLAFFISSSEQKPVYFNSLQNTFIRAAEKTSLKDINRTTLARYRDYMLRANPTSDYNNLIKNDFLEKLQIIEGRYFTYGGLLFMGKNLAINKTFADFRVDLLEIPGRSYEDAMPRYTFRLEEQENLWEYYFAIIERLRRQIRSIPYKLDDKGVGIDDSPQYDAIREALVNLLMHCDYFSPMKSRIRVFTDRIEFENQGAFLRPISELLKKDISLPRNPVIAKLFCNVRLADNAGFGFDKMLQWEKFTQAKVIFENSINVALVTFTLNAANKKVGKKLTENQQKMMDNIVQKSYISASELSRAVGISKRKIEINISKLKTKGLLERIGSNRGGYWKVN
jgi:ATP-dependent DNA helicase RecG